jgi:EAL domain-containing protein (putative c-di-GMP-specific phosphodiesterase class I)
MNAQASFDKSGSDRWPVAPDRPSSNPWVVLLVDDEPEIHEITRLVLANATFSGAPVELHSAYSAAEARTFLESHRDTALMLLDVVMETDDAGLQLVKHVRERMANADLQIVLRTGQPGMAPEREVVPVYEINGYFLKTEMVAQKLQSIVISSLRTYKYIKSLRRRMEDGGPTQRSDSADYRRQPVEAAFADAITAGAVQLLAQPQVSLDAGRLDALEIQPYWRSEGAILGLTQLSDEILDPELRLGFDAWIAAQAGAWLRSWQTLSLPTFRISVPILTESLDDCRFLAIVERDLSRSHFPQGVVDLVIPEAVLLRDGTAARDAFATLKSLGVSVTLVDFGLGLLSLPRLQRLLPDRVKIHRSFVHNVALNPERAAIARSIIALAHTLGLTVIADGVMNTEDLQFFKWEGCDVGQGDLLAKPLPVADVAASLCSGTDPALWKMELH